MGNFWSILWEKMEIELNRSISFHPKTDGRIEVVFGPLVQILRGYNRGHLKTLDENLAYIQHFCSKEIHPSIAELIWNIFWLLTFNFFVIVTGQPPRKRKRVDSKIYKDKIFIGNIPRRIHLHMQERLKEFEELGMINIELSTSSKFGIRYLYILWNKDFSKKKKIWNHLIRIFVSILEHWVKHKF